MILGLLLVLVVALALYVQQLSAPDVGGTLLQFRRSCDDGTVNGQCSSSNQPMACRGGVLVPSCVDCGCPTNLLCGEDGRCNERVESRERNFTIYFIPLGYAPTDTAFLSRVEVIKAGLFGAYPFTDANIVIVEKMLPDEDCLRATKPFDKEVDSWLRERTGKGLPGLHFEGIIPVYPYRIIGVAESEQDTGRCGCAYTLTYSPLIYVGGAACAQKPHVVLHEFGHTIGLCDEYDPCVWELTDAQMRDGFGHGCLNPKPTMFNSDCDACCTPGEACCHGRYADEWVDGFFNVMGDSSVPPPRRLDKSSAAIFDAYLCELFGVCE